MINISNAFNKKSSAYISNVWISPTFNKIKCNKCGELIGYSRVKTSPFSTSSSITQLDPSHQKSQSTTYSTEIICKKCRMIELIKE